VSADAVLVAMDAKLVHKMIARKSVARFLFLVRLAVYIPLIDAVHCSKATSPAEFLNMLFQESEFRF
jgi:hypothetical protein